MPRHAPRPPFLAAALLVLVAASPGAAATDRLERFRALAEGKLSVAQALDAESAAEAYRDAWALIDEEIVDSLATGSVFASIEFLQDRLDGFGEAWGGASLKIARIGRLVVGAFTLGTAAPANSVRVYGRRPREPALLAAFSLDGRPSVTALPAAAGAAQFLAAWEGAPSGRGTRALRVDLVRQRADTAEIVWSTASLFPEDLQVRAWSIQGAQLRVRYEVQYPGWTPGCPGQTEEEDLYRLERGTMARVRRFVYDGWHRDMKAVAVRLFDALARTDETTMAALVPDRRLRERLPTLAADPACDAIERPANDLVSVAAHDLVGRPWTLTFRRTAARWVLAGAAPVAVH